MTEMSKQLDNNPPKRVLVYGGTRNYERYSYMTYVESAFDLDAVEPERVDEYDVRLNSATTKQEFVDVLQEMASKNINVVSSDGSRVFSTQMMVDILTNFIKSGMGLYILNFNRTLNIRSKVAELFLSAETD